MNRQIIELLNAALECSVFVSPLDPGLSYDELLEVGKRADFQPGEIRDALRHVGENQIGSKRLVPSSHTRSTWHPFFPEEPEFRNFDAFDFVVSEFNDLVRAEGVNAAQM